MSDKISLKFTKEKIKYLLWDHIEQPQAKEKSPKSKGLKTSHKNKLQKIRPQNRSKKDLQKAGLIKSSKTVLKQLSRLQKHHFNKRI
ncbi:hypothetical protein [Aristophania vespae]|uniref:hypothetical protein n=1 Tax=Aristophania vespae TaxID=2697033 RepID=UPI0023513AC2|nr:hypothetical protein [Aristophania vespae]